MRLTSVVNRIVSRTFRDENNNNKADSFFRLNFNVYIDVDNRERARARDKNTKETNFVGKKKHGHFIAEVRNRGNACGHPGENERNEKKSEQEHIKRVPGKFLEVSRCSRAKQRQRNEQK